MGTRRRETLPERIRIATGIEGGLYYQLGLELAAEIERRTGVPSRVLETSGSIENGALVRAGSAELAIVQAGPRAIEDVLALVPLYSEPVLVIARAGDLRTVEDLKGRRVLTGPADSGMFWSSDTVLSHYDIRVAPGEYSSAPFTALAADATLDAAIVTMGIQGERLREMLATGDFRLLPIPDAPALATLYPELKPATIPAGIFAGRPRLPPTPVETISTTATLITGVDPSALLVAETLAALYESDVAQRFPTLIRRDAARQHGGFAQHASVRFAYFDPYGGIGVLASFMEFLSGFKELLFAGGAGLFLIRDRFRRRREAEDERELQLLKDRLDGYLEETIRIEKAQMETTDVDRLGRYLDGVTRIKLRALDELTHEALRSDAHFSIFLMQCANLIATIRAKLERCRALSAAAESDGSSVSGSPSPRASDRVE